MASLDELFDRASEFEDLSFKLGRLRMLQQERQESEETIAKARDRILYLNHEIDLQAKMIERQMTAIERSVQNGRHDHR